MDNQGHIVACDVSARAAGRRGAAAAARRGAQCRAHLLEPGDKWAKRRPGASTACWSTRPAPAPAPGGATRMRGCGCASAISRNCGRSRRRFSIRPHDWFAPAADWFTLPARCSPEENEAQVERVLDRASGLRRGAARRAPGRSTRPAAGAGPYLRSRRAATARTGFSPRCWSAWGRDAVIAIRRARLSDAAAIAAVHVATWRSAYAGILPDGFLTRMSVAAPGGANTTARSARRSACMWPPPRGSTWPAGGPRASWASSPSARARAARQARLAEGEIETLYVLDDWRDRGLGRRLMRAAAAHLAGAGCRSAFVWVLRENPSRWFYERLGGRAAAESTVQVGGEPMAQVAYVWVPIETLLQATSAAPNVRDTYRINCHVQFDPGRGTHADSRFRQPGHAADRPPVRESGVYCEILPFNADPARIAASPRAGIILSGGPASVPMTAARARRDQVFEAGRAGARHLLRADDDVRAAGRRGAGLRPSRVRPRLRRRRSSIARCSTASGRPARASRCG